MHHWLLHHWLLNRLRLRCRLWLWYRLWLWCLWQYALELGSWEMFAFAAAAAIPMLLYNGRRGPGLKWLFYGFYPAHLLILGLYACGIWPWAD